MSEGHFWRAAAPPTPRAIPGDETFGSRPTPSPAPSREGRGSLSILVGLCGFGDCPLVLRLIGVGGGAPSRGAAHRGILHPVQHVAGAERFDRSADGAAQ